MIRYIIKYCYTLAFITISNWIFGWCADNWHAPGFVMVVACPIILALGVLVRYAHLQDATETSHRIMCILILYMRVSAIVWWIYNISLLL